MKLTDKLPNGVTVDGRFYALDLDFRNVLRLLETLGKDNLMPEAREFLALKCIMKHPHNVSKVLATARNILFPVQNETGERVTSFEQDAGLIRSAFRQVYHIDLFRDRLHWLEFVELLQNLPEGNRYEEVVGIRAKPIPAQTKYNAKERENLIRAKQHFALHLTEEEAQKKYDRDVGNIFAGIMGMMQKEVKKEHGE